MTRAAIQAPPPVSDRPIRVMIVDDSMIARTATRRALAGLPGVEIVSSVGDGKAAIDTVVNAAPDVLLLDIEMPIMDGIEALPLLMRRRPKLKVVMVSTLTRRNAEISMKAMRAGAVEVLLKPSASDGPDTVKAFEEELRRTVVSLGASASAQARPAFTAERRTAAAAAVKRPAQVKRLAKVTAVAIGSSTGGPQALAKVLEGWSRNGARQPIFITQHMPPTFTGILAEHIRRVSGLKAAEGADGEAVVPGRIYVAPGGRHMLIEKSNGGAVIRLNDGPQVNFCKPAVDPMFMSLVETYRDGLLAAVLTGMGRDGRDGAEAIQAAGGRVIAQDEETSVVWGMPGAVATGGFADDVLPLVEIGPALASYAKRGAGR